MKTTSISKLSAGLLSALLVTSVTGMAAGSPAKEKQFTGEVAYVNSEEHTITVNTMWRHRTFEMGDGCAVTLWDNSKGTMIDLHPGQKVTVGFKSVHGVLAADRISQEAMRNHGIVKSIDPARRSLVLHRWDYNKSFTLANNCKVMLHDREVGALPSIKPGDHVTLVYETPSSSDVVVQIAQTSVGFAGSVVAIDVPHRTVSLAGTFGTKRFSLANDCSIVMNGRLDAPLMDLHPGQRLTIDYDQINGVDVANRIAPAEGTQEATTAQVNNP